MLDLINRVQMFQIASSKVNQSLLQRKKSPVFNLQFTEPFNEGDIGDGATTNMDDFESLMNSDVASQSKHTASVFNKDLNTTGMNMGDLE